MGAELGPGVSMVHRDGTHGLTMELAGRIVVLCLDHGRPAVNDDLESWHVLETLAPGNVQVPRSHSSWIFVRCLRAVHAWLHEPRRTVKA